MAIKSLAIKYRPTGWDEVVEQNAVKIILQQQLESEEVKNAYLFCGGAGTGKTTCARIFANAINNYKGNPIEMDAASNSGVEDVRAIIQQAKTKSLDSEYKIFIIDECHSISNTGWQAFLKLIEEPPAKSIFIFCTTDPQKIPKTILSRVQRYDFQRISHNAVTSRLEYICQCEDVDNYEREALDYIAKLADGGMRDAITLMDKCLSYNRDLTIKNVVDALGITDYDTMFHLTDSIVHHDAEAVIKVVEEVHRSGKDLKQFIKTYTNFVLDLCKYGCLETFEFIEIPSIHKMRLDKYSPADFEDFTRLLNTMVKLNADIKWETSPKSVIQAVLILRAREEDYK